MNKNLLKINLMYLLICIIDAELFETINFKDLKAVNIEQFDQSNILLIWAGKIESSI